MNEQLSIPDSEIRITFSRSGGPGGQNVNKLSTKASVEFDVAGSALLTPEQREKILTRLATRITGEGVLRVTSQRHRTQSANREDAERRMGELLAGALRERKPRKKTRVTAAAREKRLEEKKRRARLKQERGRSD